MFEKLAKEKGKARGLAEQNKHVTGLGNVEGYRGRAVRRAEGCRHCSPSDAARVSRASRSQRFLRTAGSVVGLQLQAIADFCVGLPFKPGKLEDAELIWSVGNASFSHARKGGPTFIGAKGLLSATARVAEQSAFGSEAVSVLEDMLSQLCPSCTRFITRPDGDHKRAACTDCEMSVHSDVSSAANMLRILAYRIVHGERETCYKRRTKLLQATHEVPADGRV